ncbi:MAG: bifunctional glutamate N-acetyltransferase/amino-acid acetyltransferase ArgJ [Deltaproteobacteria bacterium]
MSDFPKGFVAAGRNVGIKNSKRDAGVLLSRSPAVWAARVTENRSRAHCVARIDRLRAAGEEIRAIVAVSGNANALTGAEGRADDERLAQIVADEIGVGPERVLTACTGIVGYRLPLDRMEPGIAKTLTELSTDPADFADAIHTTDRTRKVESRKIFIDGTQVTVHAVAKGSGMIAPSLATMLCFVTTDAAISRGALQRALDDAIPDTFNQLTVDGEMSTNDAVVALANGAANNPKIEDGERYEVFVDAVRDIFECLSRAIASDGEGATRRIDVTVTGAPNVEDARAVARALAGSTLVKAAVFGGDPNAGGRLVAAAGACAARRNIDLDLERLTLRLQSEETFANGVHQRPGTSFRHRLQESVVAVEMDLGGGDASAQAWGCDLTYDYVKINADYAAVTQTSADGRVGVDDRLENLGPVFKRRLLVEALRYIDKFRGIRAVIKLGGAAMIDPALEEQFAENVLLLRSVGLLPIVVHGGGPEISRTMKKLGHEPEFIDGLRVTDEASMRIVEMVLTGQVNQRLVATLNRTGSRAVGLSGKDGGLIRARKRVSEPDLGLVGEVERIDPRLLDMLEKDGYVPVVSPIGLGEGGGAYNVNADVVASELAAALKAEKLIFLSDVPGLLEGEDVVSELTSDQLKLKLDDGTVTGGMKPKLASALRALAAGCSSVHLVDGRVQHNLIAELFTDRGVGTLIRRA